MYTVDYLNESYTSDEDEEDLREGPPEYCSNAQHRQILSYQPQKTRLTQEVLRIVKCPELGSEYTSTSTLLSEREVRNIFINKTLSAFQSAQLYTAESMQSRIMSLGSWTDLVYGVPLKQNVVANYNLSRSRGSTPGKSNAPHCVWHESLINLVEARTGFEMVESVDLDECNLYYYLQEAYAEEKCQEVIVAPHNHTRSWFICWLYCLAMQEELLERYATEAQHLNLTHGDRI